MKYYLFLLALIIVTIFLMIYIPRQGVCRLVTPITSPHEKLQYDWIDNKDNPGTLQQQNNKNILRLGIKDRVIIPGEVREANQLFRILQNMD
jgi:hypothetical protein